VKIIKPERSIIGLWLTTALLVGWFSVQSSRAEEEPLMRMTHLTTNEGLSQNTVVAVHKDKKGFLWFGTWDGLNKYDGYRFTVYKSNQDPDDPNNPINTRVEWIDEDSYGYLWIKMYDELLYRFDPSTATFLRLADKKTAHGDPVQQRVSKVWVLKNGEVWCVLFGDSSWLVETNPSNRQLIIQHPVMEGTNAPINHLNQVYLDAEGITWLLTDNGLIRDKKSVNGKKRTRQFQSVSFEGEPAMAFESCLETGSAIYFGTTDGRLWIYSKQRQTFSPVITHFHSPVNYLVRLPDGTVFAGSKQDGFLLYNPGMDLVTYYPSAYYKELKDNLFGVYADSEGVIWLSTGSLG
jgi:ligand-binding sensor domain-containing protein